MQAYLAEHPDVRASGYNPLLHLIDHRRTPIAKSGLFDPTFYLAYYLDIAIARVDPLEHYVMTGSAELRQPSLDFDPNAYLAANPDVAAAGTEPIVHFINCGRAEGRSWAQSELRTADVPSALCKIRASGFLISPTTSSSARSCGMQMSIRSCIISSGAFATSSSHPRRFPCKPTWPSIRTSARRGATRCST